jgi:hypothetical protein
MRGGMMINASYDNRQPRKKKERRVRKKEEKEEGKRQRYFCENIKNQLGSFQWCVCCMYACM